MLTLGKLVEGVGELGTILATLLQFIAKQQQHFFERETPFSVGEGIDVSAPGLTCWMVRGPSD